MRINRKHLEKLLRSLLPVFFIFVILLTFISSLLGYLQHSNWSVGDWLINYQGGFVRRGLPGECIYQLSCLLNINPGKITLSFQILFYAVFFSLSYLLLSKQKHLLPYTLLIFSPSIFLFQIYEPLGSSRKEIIFFSMLGITVFLYKQCKLKNFLYIFYLILLSFPLVILSHEMLLIYFPYLLIVYLNTSNSPHKNNIYVILLSSLSVITTVIVAYFSKSSDVNMIFNSISARGYPLVGGSIECLKMSHQDALVVVQKVCKTNHYEYYFPIFLISMIGFYPIRNRLKSVFKDAKRLILLFFSIIGTLLLMMVAIDWGRFIYIHFVSLFLVSLIADNPKTETKNNDSVSIIAIVLAMIYFLAWYIPDCCFPRNAFATKLNRINITHISRTLNKVVNLLNKKK